MAPLTGLPWVSTTVPLGSMSRFQITTPATTRKTPPVTSVGMETRTPNTSASSAADSMLSRASADSPSDAHSSSAAPSVSAELRNSSSAPWVSSSMAAFQLLT